MSQFLLITAIQAGMYALLALSLNLQYGLTGLFNFGQVVFYGVGAYSVSIAAAHGLPVWVGVVGGPVLGAVTGFLLALPSIRVTDDIWALISLGVAAFFVIIVTNVAWLAGGPIGTIGITPWSNETVLTILGICVLVTLILLERLQWSQFGRIIRAIRDDEMLVKSLGRSLFHFRVIVLMVAGAFGSIGGVVYAHWVTYVSPDPFSLTITLLFFVMVILGGTANNYGTLLGVVIIEAIAVGLQFLPTNYLSAGNLALAQQALYALLLIGLLMFRREGLLPERRWSYVTSIKRVLAGSHE